MTSDVLPILSARHLQVDMQTENQTLRIIDDLSFDVYPGESLGIVGESGSGKTVTCLSLLKLISSPPAIYKSGSVISNGEDIWQLPSSQLQAIRGRQVSYIFQEALSALNPVLKVGEQVAEVLTVHENKSRQEARTEVERLFAEVGIPDPAHRFSQYPHQLSGGMQQRVMIAMALAGKPSILIADEPTTALDVTIQVQILELLKRLQAENQMSLIFISHDLGVIAELCQRVIVMYGGQIVESGQIEDIFSSPQHPYTKLLLETIPSVHKKRGHFHLIPGQIPSPDNLPRGCKFNPRCPEATDRCYQENPLLKKLATGQVVRCWQRS